MYKYLNTSAIFALRAVFRKIRIILLLFIPISFIFMPVKTRAFSYFLFGLGITLLLIELSRKKSALYKNNPSLADWFIVIGTNFYITSIAYLTGGTRSPFLIILIIPSLFSLEFGFGAGLINLIFITFFSLLDIAFNKELIINKVGLLFLFFLAILALIMITSLKKIFFRYYQKILAIVTRDDLTGLFNRRYLKTKILEFIHQRQPFSIIMFDINFFKYYNDQWGHTMGDSLLINLAKIVKRLIHNNGFVVRNSGDEFIVVSPDHNPITVVERIKNVLEVQHFLGEECFPTKKLTISFGVITFPDQASCYEELMKQVDQKLYQNKKAR